MIRTVAMGIAAFILASYILKALIVVSIFTTLVSIMRIFK